jgi:hypothetical protein
MNVELPNFIAFGAHGRTRLAARPRDGPGKFWQWTMRPSPTNGTTPGRSGAGSAIGLKGRLSAKDFKAADPDNDGTLDKDEYFAVVEKDFNAANPDNDGTLDAKEVGSKSGLALQKLLK